MTIALLFAASACSPDPAPSEPVAASSAIEVSDMPAATPSAATPSAAPATPSPRTPPSPPPPPPPPKASDANPVSEPCTVSTAGVRWVDSNPRVPLAITEPGGDEVLRSAPKACCAAWRDQKRRWSTIDAFGQIVGRARVSSDAYYDVTDCYELSFEVVEGQLGVGLFASSDAGYTPSPSAEWRPTTAERGGLAALMRDTEKQLKLEPPHEQLKPLAPLPERTIFFRDGLEPDAPRYAVVGGQFLVVARLDPERGWSVMHLDQTESRWPIVGGQAYRALAALDLDGDARPELVIYEQSAGGESWRHVVLGHQGGPSWSILAQSIGGATI